MPPLPRSSRWASRTVLTVVAAVFIAAIVLTAGDRLPGYHRIDGPALLEVSPGRGIHLGDVVVLAVCLVVGADAVRRGRAKRDETGSEPTPR